MEKQQNGDRFGTFLRFTAEPAIQKPKLVVSGPRKDANPSVNDKLHSYTVQRVRDLAHRFDFSAPQFCLLSLSYIVPDIGYITQGKEQCLASPLLVFIHSSGANSHLVQISMLRPLQFMFIPIGWQELFQAAITTASNVVATI